MGHFPTGGGRRSGPISLISELSRLLDHKSLSPKFHNDSSTPSIKCLGDKKMVCERAEPYFQEMNFVAFFPIRGENQKKVENSQVFFFFRSKRL